MKPSFDHRHAAHCETGVISSILRHHGLDISEPMAFGLGSGLTFAYLPMIKINGLPLMAYRLPPRWIIKILSRRIDGLTIRFKQFSEENAGMDALDRQLSNGNIIGLQTSVFFLPYFPKDMRFHFNAHNLVVYGKHNGQYLISDPVFSEPMQTDADNLMRARFARGALAPKGMMYYPESLPDRIDLERLIPKAIRFTGRLNGRWNPMIYFGVYGMRMIARKIERLKKADARSARLLLGHIVRMQEEIGTGGAGFRFMYAAFLQEAAEIMQREMLQEVAVEMTETGDEWREFALLAARMSKQRGDHSYAEIAGQLRKVANREMDLYHRLSRFR